MRDVRLEMPWWYLIIIVLIPVVVLVILQQREWCKDCKIGVCHRHHPKIIQYHHPKPVCW
ncbi:hypothetical protein IIV30_148L [Invertebrate iridescent virus 30]|uniref:Uncharacterized protein n=1 Tax=Invertebrate iridescent virus 30 TaxID=345585 RepID=W8W1U4_9VIRU|nr:hypothetical protein IIV30_148L [Invertebrate iridescent virus 30]CCV02343.1 hypothetical protein IIV30_148L [Invertebrate iridescent virus 30]